MESVDNRSIRIWMQPSNSLNYM